MGSRGLNSGLGSKKLKSNTTDRAAEYVSSKEAHAMFRKETKRWVSELKPDELSAFKAYTSESSSRSYKTQNRPLRDEMFAGMTRDEVITNIEKATSNTYIKADTLAMDKAIENYTIPKAFVGYRGAGYSLLGLGRNASYEDLKGMVGEMVHDRGFMSVSSVRGAEFSRQILYRIVVPKGKGIGADISSVSVMGHGEQETLLARGTVYKVMSVKRGPKGKPIVTLKVVGRK